MDRPPLDAHSYHSVLTEVFHERLPSFIALLSEVFLDSRLQDVLSGYSRGSQNSTLPSNEITGTVRTESVLPASTVPDDRSSAGTAQQYGTKSVHFPEPAKLSVPNDKNSIPDRITAKGILKNGLDDTHTVELAALSLPPQDDGLPAADIGTNRTEKWVESEAGSVAPNKPSERATRVPGAYVVDDSDDVSSVSDCSDGSRYRDEDSTRPQNPYAYSSEKDKMAMGRGQTSIDEVRSLHNGDHQQPNDAGSFVSNRSFHQPVRLSPVREEDAVSMRSYESDLDDESNRNVNQYEDAAEIASKSGGALRRKDSRESLGDLERYRNRTRRFGSVQPNISNVQPTEEQEVLAVPSKQHQPEILYDVGSMFSIVTGLQAKVASLQESLQKSISTILDSLNTQFDGLNSQLSAVMNALPGYTGQSNQSVPAPSVSRAAPPPSPVQPVPPLTDASAQQVRSAEPGPSTVPSDARVPVPDAAPVVPTAAPSGHAGDTFVPTEIAKEAVTDPITRDIVGSPPKESRTSGWHFKRKRQVDK